MRRAGEGQLDLLVALPGDIPTHDQQDMMERKHPLRAAAICISDGRVAQAA